MFRTVPLSIIRSFSPYTQQWYVSYRFDDSLRAGSGRSADSLRAGSGRNVLVLLANCMTLLCVQWKTADDGQRNCAKHVEFYSKNEFEKLVYLVGCIIGRTTVVTTRDNLSWNIAASDSLKMTDKSVRNILISTYKENEVSCNKIALILSEYSTVAKKMCNMKGILYVLCIVCIVHCMYCVFYVLCIVCIVHCMYCVLYVLCIVCIVYCMYCVFYVLCIVCIVYCMYCVLYVLCIVCIVYCMYCVLYVLFIVCLMLLTKFFTTNVICYWNQEL